MRSSKLKFLRRQQKLTFASSLFFYLDTTGDCILSFYELVTCLGSCSGIQTVSGINRLENVALIG